MTTNFKSPKHYAEYKPSNNNVRGQSPNDNKSALFEQKFTLEISATFFLVRAQRKIIQII
jgi:hypothetical protein